MNSQFDITSPYVLPRYRRLTLENIKCGVPFWFCRVDLDEFEDWQTHYVDADVFMKIDMGGNSIKTNIPNPTCIVNITSGSIMTENGEKYVIPLHESYLNIKEPYRE